MRLNLKIKDAKPTNQRRTVRKVLSDKLRLKNLKKICNHVPRSRMLRDDKQTIIQSFTNWQHHQAMKKAKGRLHYLTVAELKDIAKMKRRS